jgi:hypothetical protein
MNRKLSWIHVVSGLAVIAALAIAVPAFGVSKSIKKAIKKEVSKQIASAKGPAGSNGINGTNGTNGTNGADGTARAYARVLKSCPSTPCPIDRDKGISQVRLTTNAGWYCVTAPGIDPTDVAAVATVDASTTNSSIARVTVDNASPVCLANEFAFTTTTNQIVAGPELSWFNDPNVAFTIVIP